jgi:hypothetical protein
MSTFAAGTLIADRIDYWIRRRVLQYWDDTHPSQRKSGRDRRVGLSAIGQCRKDQYGALTSPIAPHLAALVQATRNAETGIEPPRTF